MLAAPGRQLLDPGPSWSTATSAALLTDPTRIVPRRASDSGKSGTPGLRYGPVRARPPAPAPGGRRASRLPGPQQAAKHGEHGPTGDLDAPRPSRERLDIDGQSHTRREHGRVLPEAPRHGHHLFRSRSSDPPPATSGARGAPGSPTRAAARSGGASASRSARDASAAPAIIQPTRTKPRTRSAWRRGTHAQQPRARAAAQSLQPAAEHGARCRTQYRPQRQRRARRRREARSVFSKTPDTCGSPLARRSQAVMQTVAERMVAPALARAPRARPRGLESKAGSTARARCP